MLARFDIVLEAFPFRDGPIVNPHDHFGGAPCASPQTSSLLNP
jgi:hypothetical protein